MAKKDYTFAVGRRRTSTARVRLHPGKDETVVNNQPIDQYFSGIRVNKWDLPLQLTKTQDKFWASIKVAGGGKKGQFDSVLLGLSRALVEIDEKNRSVLRQHGLLTRDARIRERRKIGMGGKARRKKQSPKR